MDLTVTHVLAKTAIFDKPVMVLALLLLLIASLTLIMMRQRVLRGFVYLVTRHPFWVLGISAALTLASLVSLPFIKVSTSRTNLMDENNPYQRQLNAFLKEFGNPNHLVAVVEGGSLEDRRRASDRLADAMRSEPKHFKSVFNKVDLEAMKQQGLLYVPLKTLENFRDILKRQGLTDPKLVKRFIEIHNLDSLLFALGDTIKETVANPDPIVLQSGAQGKGIEIIKQLFVELEQWLSDPDRKEIRGLEDLYMKKFDHKQANLDPVGYLADRKYDRLYLFIQPTRDSDETSVLLPMVTHARALAHEITSKVKGVRIAFTGYPALVVDEMNIIQRDMFFTTVIALAGIVLMIMLVFRVVRQTVLANVALLVGLLWTVAFTIIVYGGFNIITSLFAAVLLGLGIDFGIHIIARFNEARSRDKEPKEAVEAAIMGVGPGLLTGALTTATAFYTTSVSEFTAFSELGVIAGTGMLFMLIAALTILPSLLLLKPGPVPKVLKPGTGRKRAAAVRLILRWPAAIILVGLVVTFAAGRQPEPPLDYNITTMMPEESESKQAYMKMIEESEFKSEFIGIIVNTIDQARVLGSELEKLGVVSHVEHIGKVVPEDQQKKLDIIKSLKALFEGLGKRWGQQPPIDPLKLEERLDELEESIDEATVLARRHGRKEEHDRLKEVQTQIAKVRQLILVAGADPKQARPEAQGRLEAFQSTLFSWLGKGLTEVFSMLSPKKITEHSLPSYARDRFVGRSAEARYAVYVYPKGSVWNRVFLGTFVKETTKVAHQAKVEPTGFPVTFYVHTRMLQEGIFTAAFLAALAIMLMLMLDFTEDKYSVLALVPLAILAVWSFHMAGLTGAAGFLLVMLGGMAMFDAKAVGYMLLAMIPLAMGAAWMVGMMNVFGIEYNLANVVAIPLLLGIGVVYCVHIIHRFRQEGERDVFTAVRHTGGAVFLAATTTMIGFGALMAGSHGGMKSMGLTMIIGITTCLITSLVVLPAMLRILPHVRKAEASLRAQTTPLGADAGTTTSTSRDEAGGAAPSGGGEEPVVAPSAGQPPPAPLEKDDERARPAKEEPVDKPKET
ncbi:MAG: MMPL family transporter [Polyangia bacterium]|nr:MMPL family transporter [Polyangia bacterium]